MFVKNKYFRWYYTIVGNAKSRKIIEGEYYEIHHIVPKSLGETNDPENKVHLFAREHFICHLLLTKFTEGNHKRKMVFAVNMLLAKNKNHTRDFKITARTYNSIKLNVSNSMKELWNDESFRNNIKDKHKNRWNDPANREKISSAIQASWNNERREEQSKRSSAYWNNAERRTEQSNRQLELHKADPTLGIRKSHPGKQNGMYGKTHSESARAKISSKATGRLKGKTYAEQFGIEKAQALKLDKSKKLKEFNKNNPTARCKKYKLIDDRGNAYLVTTGLKKFCIEHNLKYRLMYEVLKGIKDNADGWRIYILD